MMDIANLNGLSACKLLSLMNRKAFFNRIKNSGTPDLLAPYTLDKINRTFSSGLKEYSGRLSFEEVSHLFKRTCFNASAVDIQYYTGSTAGELVDMLFDEVDGLPIPADPVNPAEANADPNSPAYNPNGAFVGGGAYSPALNTQRNSIVMNQWNNLIVSSPIRIREKMVVFLSSWLVVQSSGAKDARLFYGYLNLLRSFTAADGLKWKIIDLIKQLTINPAMLIYLNGDENTAASPNENFGRELQELFTIGKGVQIGAGDYTNYSEADVRAAAHLFTGWTVDGYQDRNNGMPAGSPIMARFVTANHDAADKSFSKDYGNATIRGSAIDGQAEIGPFIDLIFSQQATALSIASRIYRNFVYYSIDPLPNNNTMGIVQQLADQLFSSEYDMQATLKTLFKSEHFFDPLNIGCMIKDPVAFIAGAKRSIASSTTAAKGDVIGSAGNLQMSLGQPPEVAGWKATYDAPTYDEWWINTITVDLRAIFTNGINDSGGGFVKAHYFEFLALINNASLISDPTDPNTLIMGLARIFFPAGLTTEYTGPISHDQLISLKGILLPGLPDFEWNAQIWTPAKQGDTAAQAQLQAHLINLLHYMFTMAEYTLC